MTEATFNVHIPTPLLQYGLSQREIQQRIAEWIVLALFMEDRISSGKAARLLHKSRIEFLPLLRKRGIAFVNYTMGELAEEFEAVNELEVHLNQ